MFLFDIMNRANKPELSVLHYWIWLLASSFSTFANLTTGFISSHPDSYTIQQFQGNELDHNKEQIYYNETHGPSTACQLKLYIYDFTGLGSSIGSFDYKLDYLKLASSISLSPSSFYK